MVVSPFSQLSRIHEFNSVIKQINRKADDRPIRMRLLGAGTGLGVADLYSEALYITLLVRQILLLA